MAVQIIVDSGSDILPEEAARLGVIHVPLTVAFGTTIYEDSVTLGHREFYEKLIESDVLPITSQVPPARFEEACRGPIDRGDDVVIITVSSRLSGTCQSAMLASASFPEGRVTVVDSLNVTLGQRLLVLRAVSLRDSGLSAIEIAHRLDEEKHHIRLMALLDTLEYLRKGGRVSAVTGFVGGLLSIKPVVAVENGEVALIGKARGSRNGSNLLRELVVKCGGINFSMPYCLAYSGLSDALLQKYIEDSAELWQGHTDHLPIATVGCTIGTHVGPGAVAVAFFENT